eukprot:g47120.t1
MESKVRVAGDELRPEGPSPRRESQPKPGSGTERAQADSLKGIATGAQIGSRTSVGRLPERNRNQSLDQEQSERGPTPRRESRPEPGSGTERAQAKSRKRVLDRGQRVEAVRSYVLKP